MTRTKRSTYELKKLSELWLDLAKISLGSLVVKLFEPEVMITLSFFIFAFSGLISFLVCARLGLSFAKKVKEK